ncbi:SMI1/KNR4 family protein [Cardinium endosymbiont of Oedothorax gibbosus]|uniref:SMI1/KNR4 family protein n=1 Tax=Cardinium endosymbiont of Oedothorax gibbosus TaxID=931101 RepID=UPI002024DA33|nr:SMI1/KNR4 family protein [Cardinium endosymbiont of Oedothorax gibbosus]
MEKGSGDSDRPSGSKIASMPSVGEGDINTQLDEKIKKFLDEEGSKEGSPIAKRIKEELPKTKKKFKQGTSVSDSEINKIIKKLDKSIDIPNIDKEYNEFLNKYGCIYGEGFEICGPIEGTIDSKMKTEYISLKQLGFENRCKMNRMTEEEVKSCWLIAEIDQGDQYYIKYKKNKKWLIYSMDRYGKSKIFAKNFLEFLDKFFEAYEIKTEEGDSEEEEYSELTK